MPRNTDHSLLKKAKFNKNDEFYTQYCDIEDELRHYKTHFRGKVVYCNCDDPRASNFFRYFAENFNELGLKKLFASCYKRQKDDLFEVESEEKATLCEFTNEGGRETLLGERVTQLEGDGDFRSAECQKILEQCDIVVTNPPFSLFREFVDQLVRFNKHFLIIGNINAITYKDIFKIIKDNKAWLGINLGRGVSGFIVPEHYNLYGTEARINEKGERIISPNNCLWLTNLDNSKRHEDIVLTRRYQGNEAEFPKYDNYDGINVDKTKDIPYDYTGNIGVPITFLHKFNPNQFEIIKFRKGNDDKDLRLNGECPYFRILVKNKHPQKLKTKSHNKSEMATPRKPSD